MSTMKAYLSLQVSSSTSTAITHYRCAIRKDQYGSGRTTSQICQRSLIHTSHWGLCYQISRGYTSLKSHLNEHCKGMSAAVLPC